jgi:hypothetical protein
LATPTADTYTAASGETLYAGRGAPAPSWVSAATARTWVVVPMSNTLSDLDPGANPALNPNYPSHAPWDSNGIQHPGLVTNWSGAAYDEATDSWWIGPAGGHAGYGGNEIYKCAMNAEAPTWVMVRAPSGSLTVGSGSTIDDGAESSGVYGDGRPRACHTYNRHIYVPGVGPVLCGIGAVFKSGGGTGKWAFINESDGEASITSSTPSSTTNAGEGSGACYDESRDAIWFFAKGNSVGAERYDIPGSGGAHTGSWTTVGSVFNKLGYVAATYLPDDDCILVQCSNFEPTSETPTRYVFDCATGTVYTPTFSGSVSGGIWLGKQQWHWVESLGVVASWDNSTSRTLITTLTPPANPRTGTWTIGSLSVDGSNAVTPDAAATNGTFGRFVYSPTLGGFLVFNSTSGSTYFFKL